MHVLLKIENETKGNSGRFSQEKKLQENLAPRVKFLQ